jgi:hypothetical protein
MKSVASPSEIWVERVGDENVFDTTHPGSEWVEAKMSSTRVNPFVQGFLPLRPFPTEGPYPTTGFENPVLEAK